MFRVLVSHAKKQRVNERGSALTSLSGVRHVLSVLLSLHQTRSKMSGCNYKSKGIARKSRLLPSPSLCACFFRDRFTALVNVGLVQSSTHSFSQSHSLSTPQDAAHLPLRPLRDCRSLCHECGCSPDNGAIPYQAHDQRRADGERFAAKCSPQAFHRQYVMIGYSPTLSSPFPSAHMLKARSSVAPESLAAVPRCQSRPGLIEAIAVADNSLLGYIRNTITGNGTFGLTKNRDEALYVQANCDGAYFDLNTIVRVEASP